MQGLGGRAYAFGNEPLWRNFSFGDLYLDAYMQRKQRASENKAPHPIVNMMMSLKLLMQTTKRMLSDFSRTRFYKQIANVHKAFSVAEFICTKVPVNIGDSDEAHQKFMDFLRNQVVARIQGLAIGELWITPAGWTTNSSSHCVLMVIQRRYNSWTFALCNTGDGLEYHPSRATLCPPKIKRNIAYVISGIHLDKLVDSSFWYMVYRLHAYVDKSNGAKHLYEIPVSYTHLTLPTNREV